MVNCFLRGAIKMLVCSDCKRPIKKLDESIDGDPIDWNTPWEQYLCDVCHDRIWKELFNDCCPRCENHPCERGGDCWINPWPRIMYLCYTGPRIKKVCFRIRRIYFDRIVSGDKRFELRKFNDFWKKRLIADPLPEIAVFLCGKDVHLRWIIEITVGKPEEYLERELSEQGKEDVGTDLCIATELGEVINL